jgi:branched-chain amino acid transport system permease protein
MQYISYLIYWTSQAFKENVLEIPGRLIAVIFLLALLFVPIFAKDSYALTVFTFTLIFVIYAASWDFLAGYTGQLSLGHAFFFGIAAYTCALLNLHFKLPPILTIPSGAIAGTAAGCLLAIPALRLRGPFLLLVTLAFPLILNGIIQIFPDLTGGELGLYGLSNISDSPVISYYISYILMAGSLIILWKLSDARSSLIRLGVILNAIREDEIAARASGINTIKYKIIAFSISGFFAGIAGGFYAHDIKMAGPSTLHIFLSLQAAIWVIFGGINTIYGSVIGVFMIYPLGELFLPSEIRMLVFACLMVIVIVFMPEGIGVWVRDKLEINCPRCKISNPSWSSACRACGANLDKLG